MRQNETWVHYQQSWCMIRNTKMIAFDVEHFDSSKAMAQWYDGIIPPTDMEQSISSIPVAFET